MIQSNQITIDFSTIYHLENNIESQNNFDANIDKFSNQCKIVFKALSRGERLTTTKALLEYGIGDLRRRIKDLKDIWEVPVQSKYVDGGFKEYFLNL